MDAILSFGEKIDAKKLDTTKIVRKFDKNDFSVQFKFVYCHENNKSYFDSHLL
jgi:hypothetical protein